MLVTDKDKKSFDAIRKLTRVNLIPQELDPEPRKRARFPRKFSSSTDAWKAPRKPEDPFFSRPYVPVVLLERNPPHKISQDLSLGRREKLQFLLGGTGRRN